MSGLNRRLSIGLAALLLLGLPALSLAQDAALAPSASEATAQPSAASVAADEGLSGAATETPASSTEPQSQSAAELSLPPEEMDAELAEFLAEGPTASTTLGTDTLSLYGFADFTYSRVYGNGIAKALNPNGSFYVGNLNLYLDAQLAEQWRTLMEVRFTYLPHGSPDNTGTLIRNIGYDYADNANEIVVGGIVIERAWTEYTPAPWLSIRGGQWLTPYGIWNVDHGTPTLLGIQKPYLVSSAVLPERQTGLMVGGTLPLGGANDLSYRLTLSNGRGSIDAYRDLDGNKAIGGRLELRHMGDFLLNLGLSGYKGRYTDAELTIQPQQTSVKIGYATNVRYDEAALAADMRLTWRGLQVIAEGVIGEVVYVDGERPNGLRGFVPDRQADMIRGGAYSILAYTIESWQLMPFVGYDYIADPLQIGTCHFTRLGLRFTPVGSVTLKAEWFHLVKGGDRILMTNFDNVGFQLAWAFR